MVFNFGNKINTDDIDSIKINDQVIKSVETIKLLGIVISSDLSGKFMLAIFTTKWVNASTVLNSWFVQELKKWIS